MAAKSLFSILIRQQGLGLAIGLIVGVILSSMIYFGGYDNHIAIPMEQFPEPQWRTPQTKGVRTVTSTPFARFEIHEVEVQTVTKDGTKTTKIIPDWLWTDERSHVNVLVHLKEENKYLLYRQKKYGLEKESLAVLGGLFNTGEKTGEHCARRELLEEAGLVAEEMKFLGKYRVQVNRGGGFLHIYLAKNCIRASNEALSAIGKFENDYEDQSEVKLSRDELVKEIRNFQIGEAQWLACVLMGLLDEQS
jgi:8-oxo-dGTP pyrophosphatase MutT (NUDIX family)